jgi:hypothetical protein
MPDLPSHADTGRAPTGAPAGQPAIDPGSRRRRWLLAAAVLALVVAVVLLHATGVIETGGHQ